LGEEWDFEKHAASEVNTLEEFQVDVHVEWKLSLTLKTLLLWGHLIVSLNHDTLSQKLLLSTTATDFLEGVLRLINETGTESTETDLDKCAVEKNLAVDVEVADGLLQMRHEHHIASLVVVVV